MPVNQLEIAAPRTPRADAMRNRERILEVAKEAFSEEGAAVSMDCIAKRAGIGAGTLYRHFPTRDALLAAVYRSAVAKLAAAEREFGSSMAPVDALRAWMLLFVDHVATKRLIAPALNALVGGPSRIFQESGDEIKDAIRSLVKRAVESGDIRSDLDPVDLLRALAGVSNAAAAPDWKNSAKRLVEILIRGSRPIV